MIICAYYGRIIMIMIGCECFSDICLEYSGPGNRISGPEVRKPVLKCESISTALSISGHTPPYPRTHIFLSRDPSLYLRTHPCMPGPVPKVLELGAYLKRPMGNKNGKFKGEGHTLGTGTSSGDSRARNRAAEAGRCSFPNNE